MDLQPAWPGHWHSQSLREKERNRERLRQLSCPRRVGRVNHCNYLCSFITWNPCAVYVCWVGLWFSMVNGLAWTSFRWITCYSLDSLSLVPLPLDPAEELFPLPRDLRRLEDLECLLLWPFECPLPPPFVEEEDDDGAPPPPESFSMDEDEPMDPLPPCPVCFLELSLDDFFFSLISLVLPFDPLDEPLEPLLDSAALTKCDSWHVIHTTSRINKDAINKFAIIQFIKRGKLS